jgi:hypothetical protein
MPASALCTPKCISGLIYIPTTLNITGKLGLTTDIATGFGSGEGLKTIYNVLDGAISPGILTFTQ